MNIKYDENGLIKYNHGARDALYECLKETGNESLFSEFIACMDRLSNAERAYTACMCARYGNPEYDPDGDEMYRSANTMCAMDAILVEFVTKMLRAVAEKTAPK